MLYLHTHQRIWVCMGILISMLLVTCTDEHQGYDAFEGEGDTLRLMTYAKSLNDVQTTRAGNVTVPTNYISYTTMHPEAIAENHAIGIFQTVPAKNNQAKYSRFVYEGDHWHSYAIVKENEIYYIYGFLPISGADHASITPYQDDFSQGAELTLHEVKSLSDTDVCILVGLTGVENVDDETEVALGNFRYQGKGRDKNNIYLLFNHLYTAVQFKIHVSERFASLRQIRLKTVKLKSQTPEKVEATVRLLPGESPLANVTLPQKSSTSCEVTLLDTDLDLTTSSVNLGEQYYFFNSFATYMTLESTYDVYDRYGNLVRENCKSVNKLDFLYGLRPGDRRNVDLLVDPTYIYQLSEEDLDEPFIVN